MSDHSTSARRGAIIGAATLGVLGLMLGAVVGLIYGPSDAWWISLVAGAEAGLVGGAMGALAGLLYSTLRATLCRRALSE